MPEIPVYTELASIYGLQGVIAAFAAHSTIWVHGRRGRTQVRQQGPSNHSAHGRGNHASLKSCIAAWWSKHRPVIVTSCQSRGTSSGPRRVPPMNGATVTCFNANLPGERSTVYHLLRWQQKIGLLYTAQVATMALPPCSGSYTVTTYKGRFSTACVLWIGSWMAVLELVAAQVTYVRCKSPGASLRTRWSL